MGNVRCVGGMITKSDGKSYPIKKRVLKPFTSKTGYKIIDLKLDLRQHFCVHRLVLETFNPVAEMKKLQVNHIDGNKSNNVLSNLEWCTQIENMHHALEHGLFKPQDRFGEKHPFCKLTTNDVFKIRELLNQQIYTQHHIAEMFHVSDTTIHEIKTGKSRYHE